MADGPIDFTLPAHSPAADESTGESDLASVRQFVVQLRPAAERGDVLALLEAIAWTDLELDLDPEAPQLHDDAFVSCPRWLLAALYRIAVAAPDAPPGKRGKPTRRKQAENDREDAIRWMLVHGARARGMRLEPDAIDEAQARLHAMGRGTVQWSAIKRSYYEVENARGTDRHYRYSASVLSKLLKPI